MMMSILDARALRRLISGHVGKRPVMEAVDVYKLLYQGVFGVGHLLGDYAWERLLSESSALDPSLDLGDPLIEPVSIDGTMVRVNLRPYLRIGGNLEGLFGAMKETGEWGGQEDFLWLWGETCKLVHSGEVGLPWEGFEALTEELDRDGVKPRHHSRRYREAYKPAYRVVDLGRLLDQLALGLHKYFTNCLQL